MGELKESLAVVTFETNSSLIVVLKEGTMYRSQNGPP